ncbi:MAG: hypothetical protein QM715_21045 [Nibricoccus sp.]
MSTLLPCKSEPPDTTQALDPGVVTRERLALDQLAREMTQVQKRLGTPAEKHGDCELARDLGHAIRNKLHVLRLLGVVGRTKPTKPDKNQLYLDV